jgi:predicted PurR-regulated permease PerM
MTKASVGTTWQRSIIVLTVTVVSVVAITILYWAQSIFIPVALAAFLTFLLSPVVTWLRHRGFGRTPAVIMTVCLAAFALGTVGWLVTTQITSLLRELPKYSENVKDKVKSLKKVATSSNQLTKMIVDVNHELGSQPTPKSDAGRDDGADEEVEDKSRRPIPVFIEAQSPIWLSRISSFLAPLIEYLGELALAIILVVFMLQKREELRNRLIRLMGRGRIATATKFVDEAGQRISRFLLAQAMVNGTFGLVLAVGLLLIGVKYALLWGFLAAMLRYLPYIGAYLAAVFPISLGLAMFDGWGTVLMVAGLFIVLELIVANFVEPRLYGQSMGVSEIALLVAAAFWAVLWGPIGLVLSSPLTVCLVMLGRYVPQLEFLAVLLGDEPALDPSVSFYQRLLARDQDEAEDLILEHLKTESADQVYDDMLIPTLKAAKLSHGRGDISEADEQYVFRSIREIVEDLGDRRVTANDDAEKETGADTAIGQGDRREAVRILGCPAHDGADQAALEMLQNLVDPARWSLELVAPDTLTSELLELVDEKKPALVCIAATPPGGLAHTRYLCKRLRARFPELRILVCRWGPRASMTSSPGQLEEAGADLITTTLIETGQQLASLLPVLAQSQNESGVRPRRGGAAKNAAHKRGKPGRGASDRDVAATILSP